MSKGGGRRPGRHPLPPADLDDRTLTLRRIPRTWTWHRFHNARTPALYFGRTGDNRFDDPKQDYGVLYMARRLEGAFLEVFLRDPGPYRIITAEALDRKVLSLIGATRGLKLVDLVGIGLARMRIDNRLATGSYAVAQRWSRAFHQHPDKPDGILYASRHNPRELCAAVFSRASEALTEESFGTLREHLGEDALYALMEHFGLGEI